MDRQLLEKLLVGSNGTLKEITLKIDGLLLNNWGIENSQITELTTREGMQLEYRIYGDDGKMIRLNLVLDFIGVRNNSNTYNVSIVR